MKRLFLTLTLVLTANTIMAQAENDMKTFDSNFAHVVYFWFNDPDDEEGRQRFETSLNKFLNNSNFAKTNFVGTPPKGGTRCGR
ncbi:hypothetical protein [Allomuricauda sp. d1]|uniref:hypothetical protein n=1 Tax=Allomuricauda sp. d1 TaxID=3136725 RepID=UPI0031DE4B9F